MSQPGVGYLTQVDIVEQANLDGTLYYAYKEFLGIPVGECFDIAIITGLGNNAFLVGTEYTTTSDKMIVTTYQAPDFSGGEIIPIRPYNAVTPKLPASTTGVHSPNVVSPGIELDKTYLLGDPDNNVSRVGGSLTKDHALRIFPPNTEFLIRYENEGTITMDGIVKFLFFERPGQFPLR